MPLPKPSHDPKTGKKEEQNSFMQKCMSNPEIKKSFKDNKQAVAVCLSLYRKKAKKVDGSDGFDDIFIVV